ncbi:MAG: TerC/Alx family metal homeostasis membrane protein [Candidatus Omnitrophica bacterium]|nr:TerC/Alx family metal homeostasis membrane protein [Candidatus Omnitrophota bacterium]
MRWFKEGDLNVLIAFAVSVLLVVILWVDGFVFCRIDRKLSLRQAVLWSLWWILLALVFNLGVWFYRGHPSAAQFLTAYLLEKSLSMDNLFVFLLIFSYFGIPQIYQPKILRWGILGVLVLRGIFIFGGIAIIRQFHWMVYVFGLILVTTAVKLFFRREGEAHPERNPLLKMLETFIPLTKDMSGGSFFVSSGRFWKATPLFITLVAIECSDILFAFDSIPAVFGITLDPFIVYTSNIFAVLGLRALYFVIADLMHRLVYFHYGLSVILGFIGGKMLVSGWIEIPTVVSLAVITFVLVVVVLSSVLSVWIKKPMKIRDTGSVRVKTLAVFLCLFFSLTSGVLAQSVSQQKEAEINKDLELPASPVNSTYLSSQKDSVSSVNETLGKILWETVSHFGTLAKSVGETTESYVKQKQREKKQKDLVEQFHWSLDKCLRPLHLNQKEHDELLSRVENAYIEDYKSGRYQLDPFSFKDMPNVVKAEYAEMRLEETVEGVIDTYYYNGNLKTRWYLSRGMPYGQIVTYYENGEILYMDTYEEGVRISRRKYDQEGRLEFEQSYGLENSTADGQNLPREDTQSENAQLEESPRMENPKDRILRSPAESKTQEPHPEEQ